MPPGPHDTAGTDIVAAAQMDVSVPPLPVSLPAATVGIPYAYVFASLNAVLGDTQLVSVSGAPPSLLLNDNVNGTFTLTGTPAASDVNGYNLVLVERDLAGSVYTHTLTLVVNAAP
jgi:hypothetical protein